MERPTRHHIRELLRATRHGGHHTDPTIGIILDVLEIILTDQDTLDAALITLNGLAGELEAEIALLKKAAPGLNFDGLNSFVSRLRNDVPADASTAGDGSTGTAATPAPADTGSAPADSSAPAADSGSGADATAPADSTATAPAADASAPADNSAATTPAADIPTVGNGSGADASAAGTSA